MRSRLDCAIIDFNDGAALLPPQSGVYANGRLHVHRLKGPPQLLGDPAALADMALSLQRFDACLIVIDQNNLSWARQALLIAREQIYTPMIGVIGSLTARAIDDLYKSGMVDFVRQPVCPEELRVRTERLLSESAVASRMSYPVNQALAACGIGESPATLYPDHSVVAQPANWLPDPADADATLDASNILTEHSSETALKAFAIASASDSARSTDSFSVAKGKVVEHFERAYLLASLAKSSGNIAMAARGAKKHRRAYWALLRKHNIDAAPFRTRCPRIHSPEAG